jgi:hypothetical protein
MEKCAEKAQRAADRLAKKIAEEKRREQQELSLPWQQYVTTQRAVGTMWEKISSGIKKDYPKGTPNDMWSIVMEYAKTLNWHHIPVEVRAEMLLEKHYTGEYLTHHPLVGVDIGAATPEELRLATGWDSPKLDDIQEEESE